MSWLSHRRLRGRIRRLEVWHELYDAVLLEHGDYVRAREVADRGGYDEDPRDLQLKTATENLDKASKLADDRLAQLHVFRKRIEQLEKAAVPRDHVRVLVPVGDPVQCVTDGGRSFPVERGYEEVVLTSYELRAAAEVKLREQHLRAGVMNAFAVPSVLMGPPLLTDAERKNFVDDFTKGLLR